MAATAKHPSPPAHPAHEAKGLAFARPRLGRPRRGKTLISEERLLKTAIHIVDEGGVEALSMRHLASLLGVTAMSLYRYCADHDALLDAVQRAIIAQYAPPPSEPRRSYREELTELAKALRRAFKAHPRAVVLFATRRATLGRAYDDTILERLLQSGFEPSIARYLLDAITTFTVGLSLDEFARSSTKSAQEAPEAKRETNHDYDASFIVGLLAILDGFGSRYKKRDK